MWTVFALAYAQAPCEDSSSSAEVEAVLGDAMVFYADLDEQMFRVELKRANAWVHCLDAPIPRNLAATMHRLNGLDAFSRRELQLAEHHFAAARAADPGFSFPQDLIPVESPIRDHYDAVALEDLDVTQLAPPWDGSILLDGELGLARLQALPVVFQRTDADGRVVQNALLDPGTAAPAYPQSSGRRERSGAKRNAARSVLWATAASAVVLGAGCYGAAFVSGAPIRNEEPMTKDRARWIQGRTNALVVTSGIVTTAGVGLGVSAMLQGKF